MAATDKHLRNQKTLNLVFAWSCVALLVSVVWMLWDDYNREPKKVQRQFRDVEETVSLGLMLDALPPRDVLDAARKSVRDEREQLEKKTRELASVRNELVVLRRKAADRFQDAKSLYASRNSYREGEVEHVGQARTPEARKAAEEHVRKRDEELRKLKDEMDEAQKELDAVDARMEQEVDKVLRPIEERLSRAEDYLKDINGKFDLFAKLTAEKKWKKGDAFRNLPIIDGFASPTKINQIVLNDLPIDYGGFKDVTRYDRCATCHLGIDRPGYTRETLTSVADTRSPEQAIEELVKSLTTAQVKSSGDERLLDDLKADLNKEFGAVRKALSSKLELDESIRSLANTVAKAEAMTEPESWKAIQSSLHRLQVSSSRQSKLWVVHDLLEERKSKGEQINFDPSDVPTELKSVKLIPGQITQFAAHPRLDLFVDSNSPHSMEKFGCTICHAGQGSSTSFQLASHTPNDALQKKVWQGTGEHGHAWEPKHDWDFPMLPKRFTESSCLKCHHQVNDLVRHGTKEEAPKLTEGFNLVKENGCFGCHEIAGTKGGRSIGPDLRLEPTPPLEWLPIKDQLRAKADVQNPPGTMRKVGPSLRRLSEKTPNPDARTLNPWLLSWIKNPRQFRPDTKMPHFYEQSTNTAAYLAEEYNARGKQDKDQSLYPDAELYSIAYYLQSESARSLAGEDTTRRIVREDLAVRLKALESSLQRTQPMTVLAALHQLKELHAKRADLVKEKAALDKAKKGSTEQTKELERLERRLADVGAVAGLDAKKLTEIEKKPASIDPLIETARERLRALNVDDRDVNSTTALSRTLTVAQREQIKVRKDLDALRSRYRDLCLLSNPLNRSVINDRADLVQAKLDQVFEPGQSESDLRRAFQDIQQALKELREKDSVPSVPLAAKSKLIDSTGRTTDWSKVPAVAEDKGPGKVLFMEKGCLACHSHVDVVVEAKDPAGEVIARDISEANFGPELSRIGRKLDKDPKQARNWLVQWILNPNVHHPRTRMPITHLSVEEAARIADWLISASDKFTPLDVGKPSSKTLVELAMLSLTKSPVVGRQNAETALTKGLIHEFRDRLPPDSDEQLLVDGAKEQKNGVEDERLMRYVGKKAIGRMGCYACHDIPGFESAKPIGTALNDWGKKDAERLAFEDGEAFVKKHFKAVESRDDATDKSKPSSAWLSGGSAKIVEKFYADAVEHKQREGFLNLKLTEPRAYDFNRVRGWDDRLRMPQFKFSRTHRRTVGDKVESVEDYKKRRNEESEAKLDARSQFDEARSREALMTFVLGLVAEPVPLKFVNAPKAERQAEVRGHAVLEKYNCAGCHEVRPGIYEFKLPETKRAEFLAEHDVAPDPKDHVFPESNAWTGRVHGSQGNLIALGVSTDDRDPYKKEDNTWNIRLTEAFRFQDVRGAVKNRPAGESLKIPGEGLISMSPTWGGDFARLLGPHLKRTQPMKYDTRINQRAALPPPLLREGERVQPQWLHKFLLEPQKIRPWTVLRMPKFNMSDDEARALTEYFAAVDKMNNPGIGLNEGITEVPQKDWNLWVEKNRRYVSAFPDQVKTHEAGLPIAWERGLKERIAAKEREVEGAKSFLESKDLKMEEKAAAKAKVDEAEKELKTLKDDLTAGAKGDAFKNFANLFKEEQVYAADAYRLLTDSKTICMTCHSVGDVKVSNEQGPNLGMASERLRPNWALQWIASPNRLITYPTFMPQNFPKGEPLSPHYIMGPPRDSAEAARDAVMNLKTLSELDVNRYRLAPKGGK